MNLGERWEDSLQAIQAGLDRLQSRIWTKLPVKVVEVDASREMVTLQPLLQGMTRAQDSQGHWYWKPHSMPQLPMVPIQYPSGGGWTLTFPIAKDDEGTVEFSSRCIDNWWLQGGEQPPFASNGVGSLRQHNLSDGFYHPGVRSKPNWRNPAPSASSVQIRNDDGSVYISLDANNYKIQMKNGYLNLDQNGNLHVSGAVIAGYGGSDQVGLQTHTHAQPNDSAGDVEHETNAPTAGT